MRASQQLRYARRRAGLTQRALAGAAGVPQTTVARVESGAVSPRTDTFERLLAACGCDVEVVPRGGIGVDRTLIRELLRLTPEQRLRRAVLEAKHFGPLGGRAMDAWLESRRAGRADP